MKQLIVRIDDELHAKFKAQTALHGEKMTDLVTRWIHEYLQKESEKQAIETQGRGATVLPAMAVEPKTKAQEDIP